MNLATMQSQFRAHTSGLADSMSTSGIDGYLNLLHQWIIPTEVDGSLGENVWGFTLPVAATPLIAIPAGIVALNQPKAWIYDIGSTEPIHLRITYDLQEFTNRWPDYNDGTAQGMPDELLVYGGNILFNRVADQAYTGQYQCRSGPAALTSTGVEDDIRALCTITGASWIYLQEKEDSMGAGREGGLYDIYKQLLHTRSGSRYQPRRIARSF